ncbi:MAG: molybdopterin-dependent oxidoreductase [Treponema sp.]|nr:molybdopterin-dependent oxidoreductase [Treponema sp.]
MKVTNSFVEDLFIKGMYHALIIRSPVPKGKLRGLECPELPESYHLFKAEHIPGKNQLANFKLPILAPGELSYIGQPVAILCGPEQSRLEQLAADIFVDTEEEPTEEAAVLCRQLAQGELDKILEKDGNVLSENYITGSQAHWYPEPHGALAVPGRSGRSVKKEAKVFKVHTCTQWPAHVRRSVEEVLGTESGEVKVSPARITTHLDGKIWYPSLVACLAALAAWLIKRPVKLMLSREEDFLYAPKRHGAHIQIRSTLGAKGEIRSSMIRLKLHLGSETAFENEIIDHSCLGILGTYDRHAYRLEAFRARSNIPPQGPMAGFGLAQSLFAAERHASRVADSMGQDPAEWRKNNLLPIAKNFAIGAALKNDIPLAELIDSVSAKSDYRRRWASYELLRKRRRGTKWKISEEPLRGIGIATAFQGNGFLHNDESENGNCAAELCLEKDSSLLIKTGMVTASSEDTWRSMAFDILGVAPGHVHITGDNDGPDTGAGTLSRNVSVLSRLVERCLNEIKKKRFHDPLPIRVRRSAKAARTGMDMAAFAGPSWAAAVVEVEIDTVSMEPLVRGIWLVADGGRILNERWASRTLRRAIIHALGWASREQLYYRDGQIPIALYRGYNIIPPAEIPPITVEFAASRSSDPKGIGELPFNCVPAAYIQAVSQAMDHPFEKIPLETSEILEAWNRKQAEESP